jgi:hypothetical protein
LDKWETAVNFEYSRDSKTSDWVSRFYYFFYTDLTLNRASCVTRIPNPLKIVFLAFRLLDEAFRKEADANRSASLERFFHKATVLSFENRIVDTADICEAGAALMEVCFPAVYLSRELDYQARLNLLHRSRYFLPVRYAFKAWGTAPELELHSQVLPLLTCIDVALSPPLPPRETIMGLSWNDIYPPTRFMRAVLAVRRELEFMDLDDLFHRSEMWSTGLFRQQVARAAGMPLASRPEIANLYGHMQFQAALQTPNTAVDLGDMDFFDIIFNVQNEMCRLQRTRDIGWHTDAIQAQMFDNLEFLRPGTNREILQKTFPINAPTTIFGGERFAQSQAWPKELPVKLMNLGLRAYPLVKFMTRAGPIELPEAVVNSSPDYREEVQRMFGDEIESLTGFRPLRFR